MTDKIIPYQFTVSQIDDIVRAAYRAGESNAPFDADDIVWAVFEAIKYVGSNNVDHISSGMVHDWFGVKRPSWMNEDNA